jgi:hypothetical protein
MHKKMLEVVALVAKGAELFQALERHGPSLISRLVFRRHLLTNDNHQANETKPKNQTEGRDRIRTLGFVQAAFSRHDLAIKVEQPHPDVNPFPTATLDPVATTLNPLPPFPPSHIDIGRFLLCLGSFDPPSVAEQPSAPVGPESL